MSIPADSAVLAFDVGARRIGVAVGNVHDGGVDWTHIDRLQREWRPAGFIVGDPMTLDGGDQPIRERARAFAHALRDRFELPVAMVDERNTSQEAARRFAADRADGKRRRRDAELLDAMAAAIILDRWMAMPQDAAMLDEPTSE
jgi:putative Holliday junction resolvase